MVKKMIYEDRHILRIDDDYYKVFEIIDKYVDGELIFPDTNTRSASIRKRTHDILKAISFGIPFQNIYFCEMQSGQLLAMDSSEKLKCLIEFMCGESMVSSDKNMFYDRHFAESGIEHMYPELKQTILRAVIPVKTIRYDTPTYLQIYVGNYTQEFSITQMEHIRRILYSKTGIDEIIRAIRNNVGRNILLGLEYEFVVFMTYIVSFHYAGDINDDIDHYNLEENMLYWIDGKQEFVDQMFQEYYSCKRKIMNGSRDDFEHVSVFNVKAFERTYPVFQPVWGHVLGIAAAACSIERELGRQIIQKVNQLFYEWRRDKRVRYGKLHEILDGCDLSFGALKKIVDFL